LQTIPRSIVDLKTVESVVPPTVSTAAIQRAGSHAFPD